MEPISPEQFIKNFKSPAIGKEKKVVEDLFTKGCCYWFSDILERQFGGEKYYFEIENHFISKIRGKYYDITGELPFEKMEEKPIKWSKFCEKEPHLSKKILGWCKDLEH